MKIVTFWASTSSKSIDKTLAGYATSLVSGAEVKVLNLNRYDVDVPLFGEDKERCLPSKLRENLSI